MGSGYLEMKPEHLEIASGCSEMDSTRYMRYSSLGVLWGYPGESYIPGDGMYTVHLEIDCRQQDIVVRNLEVDSRQMKLVLDKWRCTLSTWRWNLATRRWILPIW